MKKQRKKLRKNKYDTSRNYYERNYNPDFTEDDYDDEDSEDYRDVGNYNNEEDCNCDENYELPSELTG